MGTSPLTVLQLLTHGRINSGGAIQAFLLSRELVRLGHRVTMAFSERESGPHPETRARVEEAGCRYVGLRLRRLGSIRALRDLLREGFDVVHLHREQAVQRFLQASPLAPEVGAVANVGTSKIPSAARARRLRSARIDRVVVVAEAIKRLLVRSANVDPARIEVVYGAYDEQRFRPDVPPYDKEERFQVPATARLVGVVANLDPKKGHRVLAKAARQILDHRDDVWFVTAGKGERAVLDALLDAANVPRDRFVHLGFHDDVPRLLRTLDVSVSASTKGEGLTGSIRESLAMGAPVVSTAVAGNVEIVEHGVTGLLVPPKDAAALARAVLSCLDDEDAARARAEAGAALVRGRFTSAARAERMAALYDEIRTYRRVRRMDVASILYPEV